MPTSGLLAVRTSPAPLVAWKAVHFGPGAGNPAIGGDDADPDFDGLRNIVEYATGADPLLPNAPPVASTIASTLAITFSRNTTATDVTLGVQGSDDFSSWTDLARSTAGGAMTPLVAGVAVVETGTDPLRAVEVRDLYLTSDPAHPRRFLRLSAAP